MRNVDGDNDSFFRTLRPILQPRSLVLEIWEAIVVELDKINCSAPTHAKIDDIISRFKLRKYPQRKWHPSGDLQIMSIASFGALSWHVCIALVTVARSCLLPMHNIHDLYTIYENYLAIILKDKAGKIFAMLAWKWFTATRDARILANQNRFNCSKGCIALISTVY